MQQDRVIFSIIVTIVVATISYFIQQPFMSASTSLLITDSIVIGILLAGVLLLLENTVKYSNLPSLYSYQRITVYVALALLFVFCWFGTGLFVVYLLFPFNEWFILLPSLPLRMIIGALVYCSAIQWYISVYKMREEITDDDYKPENNEEEPIKETSEPAENILDRIAVKNGQKIDVVPVSEIIYLQAEGDYVMIHSQKGKFLKEQTMKSFENLLPSNQFVRVHRSSIVNVDFISQIELYDKQNQLLKMQNGVQIRVSVNGYKALKKTLQLK